MVSTSCMFSSQPAQGRDFHPSQRPSVLRLRGANHWWWMLVGHGEPVAMGIAVSMGFLWEFEPGNMATLLDFDLVLRWNLNLLTW